MLKGKPTKQVAEKALGRRVVKVDAASMIVTDPVSNILNQIKSAREGKTNKITLPGGVISIHAHQLRHRLCYISNNDSGVRPVVFDLTDLDDIEIDGNGTELLIHGEVIPFMVERCRNLSIRDLTIDWERPFLSQGLITQADSNVIELEMDDEHPFEVVNGQAHFVGKEYESSFLYNMLAFNAERRETSFRTPDHYGLMKSIKAEKVGSHRLRFYADYQNVANVGDIMVIKHHQRAAPAMCFSHCYGVNLTDVAIHHAGGMAIVGQASRDIKIERCQVEPRKGSNRMFSAHADATHFTDCHGKIELINCRFHNQLDDATNIHGIYRRIHGSGSTKSVSAELIHEQQDGVETVVVGDTVAFFDDRDFSEIGRSEVLAVSNPESHQAQYELKQAVDLVEGHTIAMRWDHDINVRLTGCHLHGNRARGFLISTLGKVLIDNNYFHVPGAAVAFNFDGNSWYESGPVEDVTIRDNQFDHCLYGVWGRGLFSFAPEIKPEHRQSPIHQNIRITNNQIQASDPRLVYAHSTGHLQMNNNDIRWTNQYPSDKDAPHVCLERATENINCEDC